MAPCSSLAFLLSLLLSACVSSPEVFSKEQEALAEALGVEAEAYGPLFPLDYYAETLKVGDTIAEVHAAIQGYTKVLRCPSGSEVYYYFSTRDNLAVRFEVYYDDEVDHFIGLVSEDWNQRDISVLDCEPGQFGER
jgi:hypothetical protein